MKRLAYVLLLLSGPAWAQPQEIEPEGLIQLSIGQAKAFEFKDAADRPTIYRLTDHVWYNPNVCSRSGRAAGLQR